VRELQGVKYSATLKRYLAIQGEEVHSKFLKKRMSNEQSENVPTERACLTLFSAHCSLFQYRYM
jgi:hypothetical protein